MNPSHWRRKKILLLSMLLLIFMNCMLTNSNGASENPQTQLASEISFFSKDYFRLLYEDTRFVFTAPARWQKKEWVMFTAAAAGVAAVSLLDKPAWEFAKRNQSGSRNDAASVIEKAGGGYTLALPLAFYIAGEIQDNSKAKLVALDSLSASMIASGIIHPALKFIVGRSAPKDEKGAYHFNPFTFDLPQSFPSGHATQSFALASVITHYYPETWVNVTAYGIASLASLARVYQGDHFLSDWTAGALIGTVVGKTVVHFNEKWRKEKREQRVFLMPHFGRGVAGLNVSIVIK